MGRERSARVSAVGRCENFALDALQGAAFTIGLVSDAQITAQGRAPGARESLLSALFVVPHARRLEVCGRPRVGASSSLRLLLDCLNGIRGLLVVDP